MQFFTCEGDDPNLREIESRNGDYGEQGDLNGVFFVKLYPRISMLINVGPRAYDRRKAARGRVALYTAKCTQKFCNILTIALRCIEVHSRCGLHFAVGTASYMPSRRLTVPW